MTDLLFKQLLDTSPPFDLIFDAPTGVLINANATAAATFPAPALESQAAHVNLLVAVASMPAPEVSVSASYDNAVYRGPSPTVDSHWQPATTAKVEATMAMQDATKTRPVARNNWAEAVKAPKATIMPHADSVRLRRQGSTLWTAATPTGRENNTSYGDLLRNNRPEARSHYTNALRIAPHGPAMLWGDMLRRPRPEYNDDWREGIGISKRVFGAFQDGTPYKLYRDTEWQNTIHPPPGTFVIPIIPPQPGDSCYTPPPGDSVALVFHENLTHSPQLLFYCQGNRPDATITVPIRRAYIVINDIHLRRVSNNLELPCLSLSMQIDAQSWTWGFSASLPATALSDVEPTTFGEPVELDAEINGLHYRLLVERISKDRSFAKERISISGRGKSAILADPYAPIMTFANSADRTAQQLMGDVLSINGVPIGWDVEWNITDWLVPANVFTHQGTFMSALNAITGAVGAYIQPHPTDDVLRVLHTYPTAPWEWNTVTPDFELPSSATSKEAIAWVDKPDYNAVYVSGTNGGILANVKRSGTAGDKHATMITDPLLTRVAASRQRGIAVLGDTGRIATVTLELPILPETGIIEPGKFVRYVDGSVQRLGIVRGTSVQYSSPRLRQTLEIETR